MTRKEQSIRSKWQRWLNRHARTAARMCKLYVANKRLNKLIELNDKTKRDYETNKQLVEYLKRKKAKEQQQGQRKATNC